MTAVNAWLSTYKDLLQLLTQACGVSKLLKYIDRLVELEESVSKFYASEV